ncbi:penicillin-binding protein 2 [Caenispirillum salinarum]|uniref:penicillin-binding protein 2 n=1 Tax=Caenispirillum salinarum TaxID=859058 RepID=UPI0038504374
MLRSSNGRQGDRAKLFSRRAIALGAGKATLVAALAGRMYYLQVVESDRYKTLAEENRINIRLLPPPRGRLVDRFGVPLAINKQNFRVLIVREQTDSVDTTLDALGRIIDLADRDRQRVVRELERKRGFVPVTVRENLSWDEMARIQVNAPDLPGVIIDEGLARAYPWGEDFAHVLGYVAAVSEDDLTGDPLLELPGFRIGKAGIEKEFDLALRGTGGTSQVEVNAVGRVIRELRREEGEPGAELPVTLDARLQRYTTEVLGDESASVVLMDVHTGEVLAMVSNPAYDPNAFNRGLSHAEWQALVGNDHAPLTNKPVGGQYAPGSTYKMVVALAALEAGVVKPENTVYCPGHMTLGNQRFHCWKRWGHGNVDLVEALAQSCDVYFYEIAKRVGIDRIAEMSHRFGLGRPVDVGLPHERSGLVPTVAWKRATLDQPWHKGETLVAGIGQGYVLTTPLQLATMTARLASGLAVKPVLTRHVMTKDGTIAPRPAPELEPLGIARQYMDIVRKGMHEVVNGARGTARGSALETGGVEMAGKTGTAQVRRITMSERQTGVLKNEELPWKYRDHALFVAYAPADNPRYACAVVVEHGGGGSTVAAPIAKKVMEECVRLDPSRRHPSPEEMLTLPPENRPAPETAAVDDPQDGEAAVTVDDDGRTIPLPARPPAARNPRET